MTQQQLPHTLREVACFDVATHRALEQGHSTPVDHLMARAGLAAARWLHALSPHSDHVTVLCGPGNNGGDGLVMARHLHQHGRTVTAVLCDAQRPSPERAQALAAAQAAGVPMQPWPSAPEPAGVVVDALLGIGQRGPARGAVAQMVRWATQTSSLRLALDVPTGLDSEQGHAWDAELALQSAHTLTFLAPKAGLFTGMGRQLAGEVWLEYLGCTPVAAPSALAWGAGALTDWLQWSPRARAAHAGHKGRQGDVWVIGGEAGMAGASRLAARAALHAGAGRVYLVAPEGDAGQPELMQRSAAPPGQTVVVGCGGGHSIRQALPTLLREAQQLVLDADALNALADDPALQQLLRARTGRTVLTPHPLEAARLLGLGTADIQAARLTHAQVLADGFKATVVLKGSGTVVAHPGCTPIVCTTGHGALGTAGTGDVLAGWLGSLLAQAPGAPQQHVAALAATWHGAAAHSQAVGGGPLIASALIQRMSDLHPALPPGR
jgi:hydroxyethylthiazole kinase-like uncharacterized protein yjeF